jgi:hypothetical protein
MMATSEGLPLDQFHRLAWAVTKAPKIRYSATDMVPYVGLCRGHNGIFTNRAAQD